MGQVNPAPRGRIQPHMEGPGSGLPWGIVGCSACALSLTVKPLAPSQPQALPGLSQEGQASGQGCAPWRRLVEASSLQAMSAPSRFCQEQGARQVCRHGRHGPILHLPSPVCCLSALKSPPSEHV